LAPGEGRGGLGAGRPTWKTLRIWENFQKAYPCNSLINKLLVVWQALCLLWAQSVHMKTLFIFTVIGLLLLGHADGQTTVATWSFNGTTAGTVGSGAHLTAANVTVGSDIGSTAFNGAEYYGQDGWPTTTTLDANAYFQFSVTANSGYSLVLNTVNLTIRHSNTGSGAGSGAQSWSLRSSLDGFASDIQTGTMTENYGTVAVTLPAAFQSIPSTVSFRLFGYNSLTTTGGFNRFVTDNINIQGQTPSGVLAVQSLTLSATPAAGVVDLQWQAEGFAEGTDFIVERSVDGSSFTDIGQASSDRYQDVSMPAVSNLFYRVRAQQQDGITAWSSTVVVSLVSVTGQSAILGVAAAGGEMKTFLHVAATGTYQLSIWSENGQLLYRQEVQEQEGDQVTEISIGARPHGVYILSLLGRGMRSSREFIF